MAKRRSPYALEVPLAARRVKKHSTGIGLAPPSIDGDPHALLVLSDTERTVMTAVDTKLAVLSAQKTPTQQVWSQQMRKLGARHCVCGDLTPADVCWYVSVDEH